MSSQRSTVGCLLNGIAVVLAILFVWSALAALFLVGAQQKLLAPDPYKQVLVEQNVYNRLPRLVAEQLDYNTSTGSDSDQAFIASIIKVASPALTSCLETSLGPSAYADMENAARQPTMSEVSAVKACLRADGVPTSVATSHNGIPVFFWMLSEPDWQAVLTSLLPPDWLKAQSESVIDQIYAEVQSGDRRPITISLTDVKTRLKGSEGLDAITRLIDAQPACTLDQLAELIGSIAQSQPLTSLPVCHPPDQIISALDPAIQSVLGLLADQIPDQYVISSGTSSSTGDPLQAGPDALSTLRTITIVAFLIPVLLLALVALCAARSVRGLLVWLGVPMLVAGAIGALLSAAGMAATNAAVSSAVSGRFGSTALAPDVADLQVQLIGAIGRGYMTAVLVDALVLTLIGAGLLVASFAVGRVKAPPQPQVTMPNRSWGP